MFVWLNSDFRERIQRVLACLCINFFNNILVNLACVKSVTSDRKACSQIKRKYD